MSASFYSILKRSKSGHLFEVKRRIKDVGSTVGFIVGYSDSLLLLHKLEMDTFRLDGYTVLREEDISQYRFFTRARHWQFRAVKHFHLKPIRPAGISLNSFPELLKSIAERYPLVTLHPEKKNPDVCYIGALVSMTEHAFTIEDLDSNCEWIGPRRMKFGDITRIDFGGGYEKALAVTAPKRKMLSR